LDFRPLETDGRGPAGAVTNIQKVDTQTSSRSRNMPQDKQCDPSQPPDDLLKGGSWVILGGILAAQHFIGDDFGMELFLRWFRGLYDDITLVSHKWADYMRAEEHLPAQIQTQLTTLASRLRRLNDADGTCEGEIKLAGQKPGILTGTFLWNFHAEVGTGGGNRLKYGSYFVGYDLLHGSNKDAGDFTIEGQFTVKRAGPSASASTVTYDQWLYTFNDIADQNTKYESDISFARMSHNTRACMGLTRRPRGYRLHIKWKTESPVKTELGPSDKAPPLKVFVNQ
jgi:hypothetical protein